MSISDCYDAAPRLYHVHPCVFCVCGIAQPPRPNRAARRRHGRRPYSRRASARRQATVTKGFTYRCKVDIVRLRARATRLSRRLARPQAPRPGSLSAEPAEGRRGERETDRESRERQRERRIFAERFITIRAIEGRSTMRRHCVLLYLTLIDYTITTGVLSTKQSDCRIALRQRHGRAPRAVSRPLADRFRTRCGAQPPRASGPVDPRTHSTCSRHGL